MLFFPVVAGAFTIGDLSYTVTNNSKLTVSVGSATTSISGDVVIPATVEYEGVEYKVTAIRYYAFNGCSSLTSVEIPNSVTAIGDGAFYRCSSLTSVEIPNSVTAIGDDAFNGCSSLTSVEIPNSVTAIGDDAFFGCSSLTSITIPNSVTVIGSNVFDGCSRLTTVEIPNSVTAIGEYAFYGCSRLTTIEIPNSVTAIGDKAFSYCSRLTTIEIPNSVTAIGDKAFSYCSRLTTIEIPNSVTAIGDYAFYGCSRLMSVEIPNSVTTIGDEVFEECTNLTSIEVPNSVTTIGSRAFYGCSSLTTIEIPNSVTTIGASAFYDCNGLNQLIVPESVSTIGEYAFYGIDTIFYAGNASGLPWGAKKVIRGYVKDGDFVYADSTKSCIVGYLGSDSVVVIPNSVTTIGDEAFKGCTNLTSIEIPNSVTTIGNSAFYNCKGLNLLNIPESVATIGTDAFNDIDMIFYAGKATGAPWGAYNVIRVVRDGYFLYADSTKSCIVDYLGSDSVVVIPNSVTAIGDEAFKGCTNLTAIEIPNSVTTIGASAFYNCKGLNLMDVPESVATIGKNAFYGIDTIFYAGKATGEPWGASKVIRGVRDGYFLYADSTKSCIVDYLGSDSVVVIPNSVTAIGDEAFKGCTNLTAIEIPNSVTTIGASAFYNCKGLNLMDVPESVATIEKNAFYGIDTIFYAGKATGAPWGAYNVIRGVRDGYFVYADGTKSCIVGYLGSDSVVVIPNSVTAIGDEAFKGYTKLTAIEIPNSVTAIGKYAFYGCSRLTSVEIPNSVSAIGSGVFEGCSSLTTIEIPNSVTGIGEQAFYNCKRLNPLNVPESVATIGEYAFYGIDTIFYAGKATGEPWGASKVIRGVRDGYFLYADSTKSCIVDYLGSDSVVVIPNSVTAIGDEAFKGCTNLTAIEIPNSVTTIGASAFYNCKGLNLMDVPESVATIGKNAFYGIDTIFYAGKATGEPWGASKVIRGVRDGYFLYADSTKSCIVDYLGSDSVVVIPNSVTAIGDEAFKGCTNLTAIEIPNSVTTIGASAFYNCKGLNLMDVPESVATIGKNAFYAIDTIFYVGKATGEPWGASKVIRGVKDGDFVYADSTKSCIVGYLGSDSVVVISNAVTVIGDNAFKGYANLTSIEIPNSVTAIGDHAFSYCSSLTSVEIPNSVTAIGSMAFIGCSRLTTIEIPNSVTAIGRGVFEDCSSLMSVEIPNSVTAIGDYAFYGCSSLTSITIPNSVTAIGRSVFSGCSGLTTIVIPNSVTAIGDYAFDRCSSLTSIEISNSVTAIGSSTFYGCSSLTSIEISNFVTGIGEQAFYNCKGLNLMDVPESVATIGKNAFYGIDTIFYAGKASGAPWGAKKVIRGNVKDGDFVYADSTKSCIVGYLGSDSVVVIPNSVVSIGAEAFNNCKGLKFLSIPDSVSFIGENAFLGVDTISYFGDAEGFPWGAKIIIHDHVYNYCYCACGMRDTVSHCIFDIYTVDDLFEFARLVNEGNQWLDARLMNDIVVNEVDWSEYDVKDTLPSTLLSSVNIWKGIKKPYRATFDGQNHSIKGLLYHSNGFFDQLSGAAIKNVGFENCRMVTYRDDDVCGLISRRADSSVFINCHTSGEILNYNVASGFVGYGSNLTFESCYNMASVEGVDVVAGFTSGISYDKNRCIIFDDCWNGGTISSENSSTMTLGGLFSSKGYGFILYINNCYNIGDIYTLAYWTDETGCGGLVGGRGAVDVFASNCYNIGKISATEEVHVAPLICNPYKMYEEQNFVIGEEVSSSGLFYHNCYYLDSCVQTGIKTDLSSDLDIHSMTSEQFANGEVCYRLNKGVTDGTQPFYQNLADIRPASSDMQSITIDPYPVLDKSHRTVYTDSVSYFNRLETTSEKVVSTTIVEPKIYSDGNTLYVKNATGRVVLYEVNGRVVYSKKAEENAVIEISDLKTGVYLLVVDGSPSKVLVR